MKLDKAIEILDTYMEGSDEAEPVDFDDAIRLGSEALKRLQEYRARWPEAKSHLLPGETPENYHPNTAKILKKLRESPLGKKPEP